MNYFLNYENNTVTVDTNRLVNAQATDVNDIVIAYGDSRDETLTASLDVWINEELSKIDLSGLTMDEARAAVFGEWDFLELTLNELDIDITDYPELRDPQNDLINEYFYE